MEFKEYAIDQLLYRGKNTIIYRGYDKASNKNFILKTLPNKDNIPIRIDKLNHEYRISKILNPIKGVCNTLGIVSLEEGVALIKEDFAGTTLRNFIKNTSITMEEFLKLAIEITDILEEIHNKKIIHLDINPNNILINDNKEIQVIDFGNSISIEDGQNLKIDKIDGTLEYISPEQTGRINKNLDYKADYYSLGICFYQMLSGQLPFEEIDGVELIYSHIAKEPVELSKINKNIPKVVSQIVMKLISKMPEDRYRSLFNLKKDLKKCVNELKAKGFIEEFKIEDSICDKPQLIEKLYERDDFITSIIKEIEEKDKSVIMIKGVAGIGKTAMVHRIRQLMCESNKVFISGKFDQYSYNKPYSSLTMALDNWVKQIITQANHVIQDWKNKITEAVGINGQILIDLVPSIELIIGSQNPIIEMGALENENRFNLVVESFIEVLASESQPLIIFMDDLQWADCATLKFIESIVLNKPIKWVYIIGAYRDDIINLIKPIENMKKELKKNNIDLMEVKLNNFSEKSVSTFIKDMFLRIKDVDKLCDVTYKKTKGNPFYVKFFLKNLYNEGLVKFNNEFQSWYIENEDISLMNVTENVVEFLIKNIKEFDDETIMLLKKASVMGTSFNKHILKSICDDMEDYDKSLNNVLKEGFIIKVGSDKMSFSHDKIQQSFYSLMTENERKYIHLKIGKRFLDEDNICNDSDMLFHMVKHLNKCIDLIEDDFVVKLIDFNIKAAIKSKKSTAYEASYTYLKSAISMIKEEYWGKEYYLCLKVYQSIIEICFLVGRFEEIEIYSDKLFSKGRNLVDKSCIYKTKIQAYQAQMNLQEALNVGLEYLKLMDVDICYNPQEKDIMEAFDLTKKVIGNRSIEELELLPEMVDEEQLAIMEILINSIPTTYKAAPMLMPIITCKMVQMSIEYGNSPMSAVAYASYGLIQCGVLKNIELGYRAGKMAVSLMEIKKIDNYKAMILEIYTYCIQHWKEHLKDTLPLILKGYEAGMTNGDFQFGGYCLNEYVKNAIHLGVNLKELEKEILNHNYVLEKIKASLTLNYNKIFTQVLMNLKGEVKDPVYLSGKVCDRQDMENKCVEIGDITGLFFLYMFESMLLYYFGKYEKALSKLDKVEEYMKGAVGMVDIAIFYQFHSLTLLKVYEQSTWAEKEDIIIKVEKNQEKLEFWSKHAPMNFLHKYYLVESQKYRVLGSCKEAVDLCNKAITLAKSNEYINDEALGNELLMEFWLENNKFKYAKLHFKEAYFAYRIWGAQAKVKYLEEKYSNFYMNNLEGEKPETNTTASTLELIDIKTIIKINHILSKEIVLENLIKRLTNILTENIGAQKVVLIMEEDKQLYVKGKKNISDKEIKILNNITMEECDCIPKSIINYVNRRNEIVMYENISDEYGYHKDEYINLNKPKSVLCLPLINKKILTGVLYLENNLISGAFTKDRLDMLKMLSSQIAICLENAKLYENLEKSNERLEKEVQKRTKELIYERDKLQNYVDVAEMFFVAYDKTGRINLVNKKICQVLGYEKNQLIGKHWTEIIKSTNEHDELLTCLKSLDKKVIKDIPSEYTEVILADAEGKEKTTMWHFSVMEDSNDEVEGVLACGIDITKDKLLREELHFSKLKLEVFSNLSHELKTPLNLSYSALQMLDIQKRDILCEKESTILGKYTKIIKQNHYRLLRLVNNIVDITKINSNSYDMNFKNCNIVDLIRMITYSVSDYVENKDRILEFNTNVYNKTIECDLFSMERIILNLLSNAVKFTDKDDEISVNIYDNNEYVTIEVKDTGIGIPTDKQKLIFERFRQIDKSFTRNSEGSGMGLTIVKLLVELHGGTINVESKINEYTKFILKIPVRNVSKEIVVIDENNDMRESLINKMQIEFSDIYGIN